jgi:hypothetical protein
MNAVRRKPPVLHPLWRNHGQEAELPGRVDPVAVRPVRWDLLCRAVPLRRAGQRRHSARRAQTRTAR